MGHCNLHWLPYLFCVSIYFFRRSPRRVAPAMSARHGAREEVGDTRHKASRGPAVPPDWGSTTAHARRGTARG